MYNVRSDVEFAYATMYAYFLFMSLYFPLTVLPPPDIFKVDGNARVDGIHYGKCTESSTPHLCALAY